MASSFGGSSNWFQEEEGHEYAKFVIEIQLTKEDKQMEKEEEQNRTKLWSLNVHRLIPLQLRI